MRFDDALSAARRRLATLRVCLVLGRVRPAIVEAEFRAMRGALPHVCGALDEVEYGTHLDLLDEPNRQILSQADIVVKLVHGADNRAGAVQAALAALGVLRAGHPTETDVLSQSKGMVKAIMRRLSVPTLPYRLILDPSTADAADVARTLPGGGAFVVKADGGNASEGLTHCANLAELSQALREAGAPVIVEPFLRGRIITVGVASLGGDAYALEPVEYDLGDHVIMDAAWKRNPLRIPATDLPGGTAPRMQQYAVDLHRAVKAAGLTRTDFIVTSAGDVYALEINTNIGLSNSHDIAYAFTASGLTYSDLLVAHVGGHLTSGGDHE